MKKAIKLQQKMETNKPLDIDGYIAGFPEAVQQMLQQVRNTIKEAVPGASEAIKYAIPTFTFNGNLVHFAGYKKHIGLYPAPTGIKAFEKEMAGYKQGKGSVQFPLDKPMPLILITKIVKFRMKQLIKKAAMKKTGAAH